MAKRVIALLGGPPIVNEESIAQETILAGHLLELTSGGAVKKNTAAAANVARAFALERDELGTGIETAYASGDTVKVGVFHAGQRVYAFIASGQNIARGAYVTTDNAGRVTATGVTAPLRIGRATESVNNSAGPGDARLTIEIV